MVKEVALISIDPAEAEAFEKTFVEIAPVIRRQPGYIFDELLRVVENQSEYVLIIHWECVKSHKDFIDSKEFPLVSGTWGPFQKEVVVRHCRLIAGSGTTK
jgi:heme-degrading monooxygenase HmoA